MPRLAGSRPGLRSGLPDLRLWLHYETTYSMVPLSFCKAFKANEIGVLASTSLRCSNIDTNVTRSPQLLVFKYHFLHSPSLSTDHQSTTHSVHTPRQQSELFYTH